MKNLTTFAFFLPVVMGGGIAIGLNTAPGLWYASLQKPFFNPPNWIFGPVWAALYLMIAIVGWRVWQREDGATLKLLLGHTALLKFSVVPGILRGTNAWIGALRDCVSLACHPSIYQNGLVPRSLLGRFLPSLRCMGGFRIGPKWRDLLSQYDSVI